MMIPFNISYKAHDGALDDTLNVISSSKLTMIELREVGDPRDAAKLFVAHIGDAVETRVKNSRAQDLAEHGYTLDLIAHAPGGVLQFGEWQINASETNSTELGERLGRMTIKPRQIRLLGCNTGLFPDGQAAIRHLSEVFGNVQILGTPGVLDGSDFDLGGFIEKRGSLCGIDNLLDKAA